jgi:hypothetical protein
MDETLLSARYAGDARSEDGNGTSRGDGIDVKVYVA